MFARGFWPRDSVPAQSHSRGTRLRLLGMAMVAVMVAAACGTAAATPTPAGTPSPTGWPSGLIWPTGPVLPTYSPTATEQPSASPYAGPSGSSAPVEYALAMGKAALLAPADDMGKGAGAQINVFGLDLLRRLDANGNLCASPTSVALALAMIRSGARGLTASEMDAVMHGFGSTGQANEIVALIKSLESDTFYDDSQWTSVDPRATPDHNAMEPAAELDVSNAVFSQKGMTLQPAYLDSLSSGFGAGIGLLDYRADPEAARATINKWASDRTKGRIPQVLQPGDVTNQTRIALANAIYLKAGWTKQFDPADTKTLPFTLGNGTAVNVPTMASETHYSYSAGTDYRAVELPLGDESLAMTIVVPSNMASFVNGLTADRLAGINRAMATYDVDLTLPRFSINTRLELADVLAAMGMPTLFKPGTADLSGITTDERLSIAKVIHQANIDVVEEGTTAAAVTVAIGRATGGMPQTPPHVQLHVDRPFLYFIRDTRTGAVLFMGRVTDPSAG